MTQINKTYWRNCSGDGLWRKFHPISSLFNHLLREFYHEVGWS